MLCKAIILFLLLTFGCCQDAIEFKPLETWDCGRRDKVISFSSADIAPSPILYPGNISIVTNMNVNQDLPAENLKVRIQLEKLNPQRMAVPCLQGLGSCIYDVCTEVIPNNRAAFCGLGACDCPLIAKTYSATRLPYRLPEMGGPIFAQILQGNFEGNITFFDSENDRVFGCLGMRFSIKANV